jgi:hypothetical protein
VGEEGEAVKGGDGAVETPGYEARGNRRSMDRRSPVPARGFRGIFDASAKEERRIFEIEGSHVTGQCLAPFENRYI